jgi:hypothetical protein
MFNGESEFPQLEFPATSVSGLLSSSEVVLQLPGQALRYRWPSGIPRNLSAGPLVLWVALPAPPPRLMRVDSPQLERSPATAPPLLPPQPD